jgi:hypothetical protein
VNAGAGARFTVVSNTAHAAAGAVCARTHTIGSVLPVRRRRNGTAFVEPRDPGPSEVVVLSNRPLS